MAFQITGPQVQDVGLRHFVEDAARAYNLTGWVQNRGEDIVGEAQGPEGSTGLLSFELDLWKGTPQATIEQVTRSEIAFIPAAYEDGFEILEDFVPQSELARVSPLTSGDPIPH